MKIIYFGLIFAMLLTGCAAPARTVEESSTVTQIAPESQPSPEPLASETPTTAPEPTLEYKIGVAGEYDYFQDLLIKSEQAKSQRKQLLDWMNNYWIKFSPRPFAEDSQDLNFIFVFDNATSPKEVGVLIQAGGEYQGKTFYLPIGDDGKYMTTPPALPADLENIPAGFGPLEVSAGTEGLTLAFQNGNWVRVNEKGIVVQRIDLVTKQWTEPLTLLSSDQIKAMSDEERLAAAPESWAEEGFARGSRVFDNLVSYVDGTGVVRAWFDLELGDFRTGALDEYEQNGMKVRTLVINDPSLAANGDNEYYIIPGEESKLSLGVMQVLAINWAYSTGRWKKHNITNSSIAEQISMIKQLVPQFASGWLNGGVQAELPNGVEYGDIKLNQFGQELNVRLVISHGEKTAPRTGNGRWPWMKYMLDDNGDPIVTMSFFNHSQTSFYGGPVLAGFLRNPIDDEIIDLDGGRLDVSGALIVEMCNMDPYFDPVALGINPDIIQPDGLQRLPDGPATQYRYCVVTNQ